MCLHKYNIGASVSPIVLSPFVNDFLFNTISSKRSGESETSEFQGKELLEMV